MALSNLVILSSRAADQYWLTCSEANIGGADYSSPTSLPTGFGDCLLLEISMVWTGLGTQPSLAESAVMAYLDDVAGAVQDQVGVAQVYKVSASIVAAQVIPDQIRYWKAQERLYLYAPDLETATTTGDLNVRVLVRRLNIN